MLKHKEDRSPNLVGIIFINEESDPDDLNIIKGATIPKHGLLKEVIRGRRSTFLVKEGSFVPPEFNGQRSKWSCGQYAETFALVLLKR